MDKIKYRIIPETVLKNLLEDSHRLACLEADGVDNWTWYMEGQDEYIASTLIDTKQFKDKNLNELKELACRGYVGFATLAEIDAEEYAEYQPQEDKK